MKSPKHWWLSDIVENAASNHTEIDGTWVPVRPIGMASIRERCRLAYNVFVGRYDTVEWPKNQ